MDAKSNPIDEIVASLLPHFGIQDATNTEEAVLKLRNEIERLRTQEQERYREIVSQSLNEMRMFNDVLNQYKTTIQSVKKG